MICALTRNIAVSAALAILASGANAASRPASGDSSGEVKNDVVFTEYSVLTGNAEIVRRMLSPLAAAQIPGELARTHTRLAEQPVNLAHEKFIVYVPERAPPSGYGLLVFVPPWNEDIVPSDWLALLDRFGLIFVSAADSGNDADVLGRRYPLALLGEVNVARRYRLDAQRIYIAGFSGGSRVAMHLALAYPDVFRGAILDAGSDPIGTSDFPLPPMDLFQRAQEKMHIVLVAGDRDTERAMHDRATIRSLTNWCITNVDTYTESFVAHDLMNAAALTRALQALEVPPKPDPEELVECRSRNESDLNAQIKAVKSLVIAGNRDEARRKLLEIDGQFGGLAAPESVELLNDLDAPPVQPRSYR